MTNPLLHLLRIIAAYLVSAVITGHVVWASLYFDTGASTRTSSTTDYGFGMLVTFMIAWLAAAPATLTMCVGEAFSWRRWWPYSIAGSAIGLGLGTLFQPPWFFPWLGLGFGVVSGGIYWAIAGRHAGLVDTTYRRFTIIMLAACCMVAFLVTIPVTFGITR